jgi:radical SAM protein with 4Fe4S-binding SPASM domain
MTLDQYRRIVERYPMNLWNVRTFLHGEPTLHPDLVEITRLTGTVADSVGFTTNGVLLNEELFLQLVDVGVTVIAFSFEGTSEDAYAQTRGPHYATVARHIRDCCRINAELGDPVRLSVNIVDTIHTHPDLPAFRAYWGAYPGLTGGVTVSQCGDWAGQINTSHLKPEGMVHYPFVPVCPAPWFLVNVYWNGDVAPCCVWNSEPFGNIFTEDLQEIWRSERYVAFRETQAKGRSYHPYCRNCKANPFPPDSPYLKPKLLETFVVNPIKRRLK